MRPRIISLACLFVAAMTMAAQGIKRHEYWIDADYSHHQTVSGGATASMTISTAGLAPGIHFFNHRAQNTDDAWGTLYRTLFYVPADPVGNVTIGSYEYWIDDNYASRITGSGTNVKANVDVSRLAAGLHFFNFRAVDNLDNWSYLNRYGFYIPERIGTDVARVEYWIDDDYAHAASLYINTDVHPNASGNDDSVIVPVANVDISQLSAGLHFFCHRDFNANGDYGCLHRSAFFIPQMETQDLVIEEYEYWIDDNTPTSQTVGSAQSVFKLTLDISVLAEGEHTFSFRAKNSNGWGDVFTDTFVIEPGGVVPDEPQLTATFSVKNAIDGVVYENKLITSVEYTNISAERQKFYPAIYQSQLTDGEWTGRSNIYSGSSRTLNGGESYQTGTNGSCNDGRYKLEYGYRNADDTKEYILGSTEVEVKVDDRYVTIVQDDEMMTYCDENDLDFASVDGLRAYTAEGFNTARSEALMMRVNSVPAKTGLLLVGAPRVYLVPKQASSVVYVNMLVGVLEGQTLPLTTDNGYSNYVFERGSNGLGFYPPYNNNYVYAHQAYLRIPTRAVGNSEYISVKLDDTTGISETTHDSPAFNIYTLSGILVKCDATSVEGLPSGIYIVNGSKIVIK